MAGILRLNTRQGQALAFHSRERRKSLFDPKFELFGTHAFDHDATGINLAVSFPGDAVIRPVTMAIKIRRTGAAPNGIVFEFGNSAAGIAVFIDGDAVGFEAGGVNENGVGGEVAGVLNQVGQELRLTFTCIPGAGLAGLYANHALIAVGEAQNGNFPNGWAALTTGAVGQADGEVTDRLPPAQNVALTDVDVIQKLLVYEGQYPRQFEAFSGVTSPFTPLVPLVPPPPVTPDTPGSFSKSFSKSFSGGGP